MLKAIIHACICWFAASCLQCAEPLVAPATGGEGGEIEIAEHPGYPGVAYIDVFQDQLRLRCSGGEDKTVLVENSGTGSVGLHVLGRGRFTEPVEAPVYARPNGRLTMGGAYVAQTGWLQAFLACNLSWNGVDWQRRSNDGNRGVGMIGLRGAGQGGGALYALPGDADPSEPLVSPEAMHQDHCVMTWGASNVAFMRTVQVRPNASSGRIDLGALHDGSGGNASTLNQYTGADRFWHQVARGNAHGTQADDLAWFFSDGTNWSEYMRFDTSDGTVRMPKVVTGSVTVHASWTSAPPADYVFAPQYRLTPLSEIERFVAVKRHLPGVPSAMEQIDNGIDVYAMMNKQLEKIEELTLYAIQAEKERDAVKAENAELRGRLDRLEAIVAGLAVED